MECKLVVGQHVVLRDDVPATLCCQLKKGVVYTVREVLTFRGALLYDDTGEVMQYEDETYVGIRLKEIPYRVTDLGVLFKGDLADAPFSVEFFRPLDRLKVEDFVKGLVDA